MKPVTLTSRGRYAVDMIIAIAKHDNQRLAKLSDIAETLDISLSYAEQLIAGLRRGKIVESYRGPGGGYALAADGDQITVASILIAAEDTAPAKRYVPRSPMGTEATYLWGQVDTVVSELTSRITLSDLLNRKPQRKAA